MLRLAENQGFASGVNAGVASARGDVVALLNDDAVAPPGWLESSERVLKDGEVAAVGPKILLARAFGEVVLEDDVHFAPGDGRPLGRKVTSAALDGEDVLAALVGPGVHRLEQGAGDERWRWTAGSGCLYVPLPDPGGPSARAPFLSSTGRPSPFGVSSIWSTVPGPISGATATRAIVGQTCRTTTVGAAGGSASR